MKNVFSKVAFIAVLVLALSLTLSCTSDGNGGGSIVASSSSSSVGDSCIGESVTIGTQTWHKCNMNVAPSVGNSSCYYDDPDNCTKYGRLYDWEAAMSVCPPGWHLPTNADWDTLKNFIEHDKGCSRCDAKHLKSMSGWNIDNGLDSYEFSALPGGYGYSDGSLYGVGSLSSWWSASEYGSSSAYRRYIYSSLEYVDYYGDLKSNLCSVRCLQDKAIFYIP